jgi:hypothetical protein
MALWERLLACRLFATLGMRCILASVSLWGWLEAINGHFPRWSFGRRLLSKRSANFVDEIEESFEPDVTSAAPLQLNECGDSEPFVERIRR